MDAPPPSAALTTRQLAVARLYVLGRSHREIGDALGISQKTVARHLDNIGRALKATGGAGTLRSRVVAYLGALAGPHVPARDWAA